jgi:site-specific DNA-methyltransferase (adenine-specific)
MSRLDVHFSSASIEWGTPDDVIALVRTQYPLVLDVCATPGRQKAPNYFAPPGADLSNAFGDTIRAVDGLIQDWAAWCRYLGGAAWMNPPFGRGVINRWVEKAALEADKGACVIALLPVRSDTSWWHNFVEPVRLGEKPGEVIFWRGRMRFADAAGKVGDAAPFPVALVAFGSLSK